MISVKNILRISVFAGIMSWSALTVLNILILFSQVNNVEAGISSTIPVIVYIIFIISVFVFYHFKTGKAESINFLDLLWRVFVTGLVAIIVSLLIKFLLMLLSKNKFSENVFLINLFYHINLGLITAFLISTFVVWKRLILYQKSKNLIRFWNIFQYSLLVSAFLSLFNITPYQELFLLIFSGLTLMGIVLSVNLKWVAYLNFKQKWKSILFILLIVIYVGYFFQNLSRFSSSYTLAFDLLNNVFILALFAFIFLYAIFSLLVILFNLPTSSVFEQKLEEIINFQRLSQSIPTGQTEEQVYNILLDSSMSTVFADAAWLEVNEVAENKKLFLTRGMDPDEVKSVKTEISDAINNKIDHRAIGKSFQKSVNLKKGNYRSAIQLPLVVKDKKIGTLNLLKTVSDGFNREMNEIVYTFLNQASVSLENFKLISEALENERYKEELKIAKRVQRSLLPQKLAGNEKIEITAFSESADEVGGDYYDTYQINNQKLAVIIGDVSGKGTSAAFNMSQMKGVFHSLAQLDLSPKEFMIRANEALSACLEKTSFITASIFLIDTNNRNIQFSRAGHCPALYYSKSKNSACYFRNKGLGLGILRNSDFHNYVESTELTYEPGDIMVLYTDGITEAKNGAGDEYGFDRLKKTVEDNKNANAMDLQKAIKNDIHNFWGDHPPHDDYTSLILKFKNCGDGSNQS